MSRYIPRSPFWDEVNEPHHPEWTRAETALLLADLGLPDLPSTVGMRQLP